MAGVGIPPLNEEEILVFRELFRRGPHNVLLPNFECWNATMDQIVALFDDTESLHNVLLAACRYMADVEMPALMYVSVFEAMQFVGI